MIQNAQNPPVARPVLAAGTLADAAPSSLRYRSGVLIANPTGADLLVQLRPVSSPPPTAPDVVAVWSYRIPAGSTLTVEAGALTAVYLAATAPGTANVQEIG